MCLCMFLLMFILPEIYLLLFSHQVVPDSLRPPCTVTLQLPLSYSISWSFLKFMPTELVMLSNHLILYCPLLLLPSVFPSIRFTGFLKSEN